MTKHTQPRALRSGGIGLAIAMLVAPLMAGEIQRINTEANFGPQTGTVRTIYDRPYADVGAVSYGEIGWDAVKAVDPGIIVYNNTPVYGNPAQQIIADCVMAPRTEALTLGGDKQCNDTFQTHKRYKMNATGFGPIDMVFTVKNEDAVYPIYDKNDALLANDQDTARNVYRMIGKLNNHTGKRMSGFKVELGHNVGGAFVPATDTSSLRIALREEGDAEVDNDLTATGMAEFPGGLFYGPADDKHYWGFFSSERAGFTVDQTALKTGTVTFGSTAMSSNYETPFGKWLPINWVPTGVFFDEDGNPASDAVVKAWNDGSKWISYVIDDATGARTEETLDQTAVDALLANPATVWSDDGNISTTTGGTLYGTWDPAQELYVMADNSGTKTNDEMAVLIAASPTTLERRPGYLDGPIEDLANLNLNYFIEVGDISGFPGYDSGTQTGEFTLRITPLEAEGDAGVTPPWVPEAVVPVDPVDPVPAVTDDGGGCSAATSQRPVDPVLPLLAALGLVGWGLRRARRH